MWNRITCNTDFSDHKPIRMGGLIVLLWLSIIATVAGYIDYLYKLVQINFDYYPGEFVGYVITASAVIIFTLFTLLWVEIKFDHTPYYKNISLFLSDYYKRNVKGCWIEYYLTDDEVLCGGVYIHSTNLKNLVYREKYSILVPIGGWRKKYHIAKEGKTLDNAILKAKKCSERHMWGSWDEVTLYDIYGDKISLDIIEALKLLNNGLDLVEKMVRKLMSNIDTLWDNAENLRETIEILEKQRKQIEDDYRSLQDRDDKIILEKAKEIHDLKKQLEHRDEVIFEACDRIEKTKRFVKSKEGAAIRKWLKEESYKALDFQDRGRAC